MIWNPDAEAMERPARARLQAERLRDALGLTVEVMLLPPRTIARSEGKAVRVVLRSRPG